MSTIQKRPMVHCSCMQLKETQNKTTTTQTHRRSHFVYKHAYTRTLCNNRKRIEEKTQQQIQPFAAEFVFSSLLFLEHRILFKSATVFISFFHFTKLISSSFQCALCKPNVGFDSDQQKHTFKTFRSVFFFDFSYFFFFFWF